MAREPTSEADERQDSEKEGQDAETVDERRAFDQERPTEPDPTLGRTIPPPD